jgi:hypothetical protein
VIALQVGTLYSSWDGEMLKRKRLRLTSSTSSPPPQLNGKDIVTADEADEKTEVIYGRENVINLSVSSSEKNLCIAWRDSSPLVQ